MTIRAALDRYRGGLWRTDRTAAALVLAALVLAALVGARVLWETGRRLDPR